MKLLYPDFSEFQPAPFGASPVCPHGNTLVCGVGWVRMGAYGGWVGGWVGGLLAGG